jgi:uncharacterized protein
MERIKRVLDIYAGIDQEVTLFQLKTGLRCLQGCGSCCASNHVEVTAVEMLAAAHEILRRGEADRFIPLLRSEPSVCVFYQEDCPPDAPGHCTMYAWRPAVCRLFGYAAVRDRLGAPRLAACKRMKQDDPAAVRRASECQDSAPRFQDFEMPLAALDVQNRRLLPINAALCQAIMQLGLQMQIRHSENLGSSSAA